MSDGLLRNVAGQQWHVFAFNKSTNDPILADAANITANLYIDGGVANAVDDTNPTELEDGYYIFELSQAETNGSLILISPESSTADVQVVGVPVSERPTGAAGVIAGTPGITRTLLEARFGADNISQWADLNNNQDAVEITDRIDTAISFATQDAWDRLRGGVIVTIPITGVLPFSLTNAIAGLAGVWLYTNRGINDVDDKGQGVHRLARIEKQSEHFFQKVRAGSVRLDIDNQTLQHTWTPTVITIARKKAAGEGSRSS